MATVCIDGNASMANPIGRERYRRCLIWGCSPPRWREDVTKHPEVNLAVFNKDRLLYKNLKMLPDVPFDYTGFERLDYRTVTIFLKVDDPFTKRLLHELLNDVAFKLLQIEDSEKIERLYSELKEVSNYRLTFMRSISHELKTPLNVIQGNLQLAKLGVYGDVSHLSELLEEIESAVKRATQLINNLLDLSRIETEGFYVKVEPVRFEMFKQIMKEYELLAQQKGLHFDFHFQGEEPFSGDFRIISTILSNLLSNAVKYTGCGEIKGFLQVRGDRIIIEVSDTGSGIPLELQEKIFEPFVSGESGGSGLGLAIVKKFVDLLKGKITFISNVGEGTTFHIEIPRVYRPSHYENKEHVNVLLIEPDESTRRLLRKIVSDYTVVEALTGQEGYLKALEHSPDLVITGLRLPDIGGDELLYRLRGEEALNRSKLVLYVGGKIEKTDTYLMGLEIDIGELASRLKILLGDKLLLVYDDDEKVKIHLEQVKSFIKALLDREIMAKGLEMVDERDFLLYDTFVLLVQGDPEIIATFMRRIRKMFYSNMAIAIVFVLTGGELKWQG